MQQTKSLWKNPIRDFIKGTSVMLTANLPTKPPLYLCVIHDSTWLWCLHDVIILLFSGVFMDMTMAAFSKTTHLKPVFKWMNFQSQKWDYCLLLNKQTKTFNSFPFLTEKVVNGSLEPMIFTEGILGVLQVRNHIFSHTLKTNYSLYKRNGPMRWRSG